MRQDMCKVFTEPSRRPDRRVKNARARYLSKTPATELPSTEAMRSRWNGFRKERSLSYKPVDRFLASRVGQPWASVWSEVCSHCSLDNFVQRELRARVEQQVAVNVCFQDGRPYTTDGLPICDGDFWVDPKTGLLQREKRAGRRCSRARKTRYRQVSIDQQHKYVLIRNCWFLVEFLPLPGNTAPDVILSCANQPASALECRREWGAAIFASGKKQINGRLIQQLKKRGILPQ